MANILHVYLPGTQMTPILIGKGLVLGCFGGLIFKNIGHLTPLGTWMLCVFFGSPVQRRKISNKNLSGSLSKAKAALKISMGTWEI